MIFLLNSRFLFFFRVVHEENKTQKISSNKNWCTWLFRSEFFPPKIIFTFHFIYQRKINCSETKLLFYADFLFLSSQSGDWTTFVASAALLLMSQAKIKQDKLLRMILERDSRNRRPCQHFKCNWIFTASLPKTARCVLRNCVSMTFFFLSFVASTREFHICVT